MCIIVNKPSKGHLKIPVFCIPCSQFSGGIFDIKNWINFSENKKENSEEKIKKYSNKWQFFFSTQKSLKKYRKKRRLSKYTFKYVFWRKKSFISSNRHKLMKGYFGHKISTCCYFNSWCSFEFLEKMIFCFFDNNSITFMKSKYKTCIRFWKTFSTKAIIQVIHHFLFYSKSFH